jgi:hypothetical protein
MGKIQTVKYSDQKYGEVMVKIGKKLKLKPQSYFEMPRGK